MMKLILWCTQPSISFYLSSGNCLDDVEQSLGISGLLFTHCWLLYSYLLYLFNRMINSSVQLKNKCGKSYWLLSFLFWLSIFGSRYFLFFIRESFFSLTITVFTNKRACTFCMGFSRTKLLRISILFICVSFFFFFQFLAHTLLSFYRYFGIFFWYSQQLELRKRFLRIYSLKKGNKEAVEKNDPTEQLRRVWDSLYLLLG